ncbi:hypothetical protein BDA96_07G002400 [Sorghum bicolor]|uniref:Uncharacterized protein n=2 Tax=Sorghum bicolor TaxID=4558 RepID=A0A921QHV5_SORBI|nr:hypothetical protein BDA96_07G002400 [Sorghum bicolor]KXG24165.1 hypothetical protein SORBI_3007G002400 [Sorghum bicolor]
MKGAVGDGDTAEMVGMERNNYEARLDAGTQPRWISRHEMCHMCGQIQSVTGVRWSGAAERNR